ncbi:GNAT family N-acetyltransferase [Streptomyces huiliensis]|uniref:GNAT family N-acetyltransferase n=1 Tax=Streptomyces huiliensis TaxID=2876027 RepID=UPI001CBDDB88|nr:GNAT family N-acetyltransferase [Streptomyces huiliensis]MBZ4320123.1 GNAT family N-acetyltransferase [Streptomyces huiliensis]
MEITKREDDRPAVRRGGVEDLAAVLAMLDSAVEWLTAHGRTGQWGAEPFSTRPSSVEKIRENLESTSVWIAEDEDGIPVGALTLSPRPSSYVEPAGEPEVFVRFLVTDRRRAVRGVGAALLAHAAREARRQGVDLLRVDCYAGGDGALVAYYRGQGFVPAETFTVGDWPGQVLERRLG